MNSAMLLGVLVIAAATDLWRQKVYNWLTFPALGIALVLSVWQQGWPGLAESLLGLLVGSAVFFPAYYWGGMGAGDIKLMAVVGALMGWKFCLNTALFAALIGGAFAILLLLARGELWVSIKNIGRFLRSIVVPKLVPEPLSKKAPLPFAVFIGCGAVAAQFLPSLLF